jgi:hypothetical protein
MADRILHVIVPLSNPRRYERRYELHQQFVERLIAHKNIRVYTVEIAFGDRSHGGNYGNHTHICLRSDQEIWHKENMINIGISKLPTDWQYVAWIDADVAFNNLDFVNETIEQLQHYPVVQMFQTAIDLGPDDRAIQLHQGFAYLYSKGMHRPTKKYSTGGHPGYAWACTRHAFNTMGGLIEIAILGAADRHMAYAFVNQVEETLNDKLTTNYKSAITAFQMRCKSFHGELGYVNGNIVHYWHGKKADRKYSERWQILINNQFDPYTDLKYDWQGVLCLVGKPKLKRDIQDYFIQRNEDSIDE